MEAIKAQGPLAIIAEQVKALRSARSILVALAATSIDSAEKRAYSTGKTVLERAIADREALAASYRMRGLS